MQIKEISNSNLSKLFIEFPVELYSKDKNWIRPLDADIQDIFDKEKNKYFRHGEATRWLLLDNNNKAIGRIAAFIDRKTAKKTEYVSGGCGFFECINDINAATLLFDTAKSWLQERGMECMDGPINFGDRDKWWGLLIDGFYEPIYGMPYHHAYYKELFEQYGFQEYFKQYTYHRFVEGELPSNYKDKSDRIARDSRYVFRHIEKSKLEKYAEDFRTIYNKAWAKHSGVSEMPKAQAMNIMKQMKPVLDEDIIWFAYYDNQPIAFFIMIPELNQLFKNLNGKLKGKWDIWAKLKFLYNKYTGVCKKMFGVAFGVVPEFQGKGLEGAIVMAAARHIQPMGRYTEFEMNWIGDFNPKMMHVAESAGGKVRKIHATYRYIFDRSKPFQRMKTIE
jgi:GNAT superfamily N-acetyltransferase